MTTGLPQLLAGPHGPIEYLTTGAGDPVTVFVHGLTGTVAQTRPFGSGVRGTRVFVHLRGHAGTPVPRDPDGSPRAGTAADLVDEVAAVLTATGATRALGVSLGALVLLRLLADAPDALDRVVLCLPPASTPGDARPGTADDADDADEAGEAAGRYARLAAAIDDRDVEGLAGLLRAHQPARVRALPAVRLWARRHAADLVEAAAAGNGAAAVLRAVAALTPQLELPDLAAVRAAVLVVAHEDDAVHPVAAARRLAEALPRAELVVLPPGGVPWTARDRLREVVSAFLNGSRTQDLEATDG